MRVPIHAAINESVNLAKRRASKGSVGFVNAVLRKVSAKDRDSWIDEVTSGRTDLEALSFQYSHPIWIIQAFKAAIGSRGLAAGTEDLLESNNRAAKVSLVALPGFCSVNELGGDNQSEQRSPLGVEISGNPSNLECVRKGFARVQDQGSQ
ncbi:rRNA small subunit methyltransferase B, partial [Escherichia coli]|nr:rRNA small subunit methyltransferase B [Escherichia coli]